MSKIALSPDPNGTGTFTIAAPNGNTNRTITLPDAAGTVFTQGNIVGTVTESGGIPTGAIIERGSVSPGNRGQYIRYADGTQICWSYAAASLTATDLTGSVYRTTATSTWTFPVAFIESPVVTGITETSVRWVSLGTATTTDVSFRHYAAVNSATGIDTRLMAVGRWF
jgi:hypothetical protein